jgi:hypothetical protein
MSKDPTWFVTSTGDNGRKILILTTALASYPPELIVAVKRFYSTGPGCKQMSVRVSKTNIINFLMYFTFQKTTVLL